MLSDHKSDVPDPAINLDLKSLTKYANKKNTSSSHMSIRKYLITRWLTSKLKEAKSSTDQKRILIIAHQANGSLESNTQPEIVCYLLINLKLWDIYRKDFDARYNALQTNNEYFFPERLSINPGFFRSKHSSELQLIINNLYMQIPWQPMKEANSEKIPFEDKLDKTEFSECTSFDDLKDSQPFKALLKYNTSKGNSHNGLEIGKYFITRWLMTGLSVLRSQSEIEKLIYTAYTAKCNLKAGPTPFDTAGQIDLWEQRQSEYNDMCTSLSNIPNFVMPGQLIQTTAFIGGRKQPADKLGKILNDLYVQNRSLLVGDMDARVLPCRPIR